MFSLRVIENARRCIFCESATIYRLHRLPSRPSSTKAPKVDVEALLKNPSWSVRETLFAEKQVEDSALITKEQLHHLLRLSALPVPASSEEEAKMMGDLKAHLRFVQAIQQVDTDGVEPLQMIRDETEEAKKFNTISLDSLKKELAKEEVVGGRGRIRKKAAKKEQESQAKKEIWNPLSHASRTHGPYFVVNTAKD